MGSLIRAAMAASERRRPIRRRLGHLVCPVSGRWACWLWGWPSCGRVVVVPPVGFGFPEVVARLTPARHLHSFLPLEVLMSGLVRRRVALLNSGRPEPSPRDSEVRAAFPALLSYLVDPTYEDGSARLTSSLTVFSDEGMLKACLNDRQEGVTLWVSGPGLWSLLEALDGHLLAGTGDWRVRREGGGTTRRRK